MTDERRVAGDLFAAVIEDNLERQQQRKASLEQRGLAVVTTSGTLVTLSFGFVAIAAGDDGADLSGLAGALLASAMAAFILAAVLGLVTNTTRAYSYISTSSLERLCQPRYWAADPVEAARQVAAMQVRSLRVARTNNAAKARLLRWAISVEVLAVGLLGLASAVTL